MRPLGAGQWVKLVSFSSSPQSPKAGPALFVLESGTTRQHTALSLRTSADKLEKSSQ